jgi:hypothetical protein
VPCTAGRERRRHFGRGDHRADRKPAAEPLGAREDVRDDALLHVREERAGASHAALDLVEHEQRAVRRAQAPCRLEERRRAGRHAALALHGLEDDGADVVAVRGELGLERRDVVVRHVRDARRAWGRSPTHTWVARRR